MRNNPSMIKPVAIVCVIYFICLMLAGNFSLCAELLQKVYTVILSLRFCVGSILKWNIFRTFRENMLPRISEQK